MTVLAIRKELILRINTCKIQLWLVKSVLHRQRSRIVRTLIVKNISDRLNLVHQYVSWEGQDSSKSWRNILWSDICITQMVNTMFDGLY